MFFKCFKPKKNVVIIDWVLALDQCGGDENFLFEILKQTYIEITGPLSEIDHYSSNQIREYAHMVKGVSQNLYCKELEIHTTTLELLVIEEGDKSIKIKKSVSELKSKILRFENLLKQRKIID